MSLKLIYFNIYLQMDTDPPHGIQELQHHLDIQHLLAVWYHLLTLRNQAIH